MKTADSSKTGNGMKVRVVSFSYPRGIPEDEEGHGGGFVFDCRGLPNPFWVESLRGYSGKDDAVREFFAGHREEVEAFVGAAESLVRQTVTAFLADGKRHLIVRSDARVDSTGRCSWRSCWQSDCAGRA